MSMDRDVVISLEILAPTKSCTALQKAITSSSASAVLQRAVGSNNTDLLSGSQQQGTAPCRPIQGAEGAMASSRGRGKHGCFKAPAFNSRTSSLFGFLNHTATACGARLLRTNLLQPLTDITTLELRLDSLQVNTEVVLGTVLLIWPTPEPTWH